MQLITGEPCILRLTLNGETWDFDDDDLTVDQMIWIEEASERSCGQWIDGVMERRARPLQVLICFLQGRSVRPEQIQFRSGDLRMELVEKPKAPKAAGGKPATKPSHGS